jgi:crotonobetainyl-CoA:carnitine CoA-transferase CaiB-like acyl-CoA transferase
MRDVSLLGESYAHRMIERLIELNELPTRDGPLSGITVVDFSMAMAGPTCTMLLGDFGADVIKVEPPTGEMGRSWGRERYGATKEFSGLFLALNRNKRGVVLDLKDDGDRELALDLIRRADVVVESFSPGTADRLGIGYGDARAVNAEIVYCSISGFGQAGPMRDRPGIDQLMQAFAGHMSITGEEGRPSVRIGHSANDMLTGSNAAIGILMALRERDRTGRGQYVETSLYDTALHLITHFIADYTGSSNLPGKSGPHFAFSCPFGVFQARDREFFMGAGNDRMFTRLCNAIDRRDLLDDPRFATNPARLENRELVHALLTPIFATQDAADWVALGVEHRIPVSLVNGVDEVVMQAQAAAREMVVDTGIDGVKSAGIPIKLDRTPGRIRRGAPQLGADSAEVFGRTASGAGPTA